MSWKEEKAKLLFSHKLEERRICLNRCLGATGLVIVVLLTYFVAQKYSAEFNKETEIAKETESAFLRRQLDALELVDSLYNNTYISYRLGALGITSDTSVTKLTAANSRLTDDVVRLGTALRRNKYYFAEEYWDRVHMRNMIFLALVNRTELWKGSIDFIEWLSDDFVYFTAAEFARLTNTKPPPYSRPVFKLIQTDMPRSSLGDIKESSLKYFKANLQGWAKFMDSLAATATP